MKGLYDVARHLVWLTQFGLSIVIPPVLCIMGAVWLQRQFALGGWVVAVGVFVGVLAAVSCLQRFTESHGSAGESPKQKGPPPANFNQH